MWCLIFLVAICSALELKQLNGNYIVTSSLASCYTTNSCCPNGTLVVTSGDEISFLYMRVTLGIGSEQYCGAPSGSLNWPVQLYTQSSALTVGNSTALGNAHPMVVVFSTTNGKPASVGITLQGFSTQAQYVNSATTVVASLLLLIIAILVHI